MSNRPAAFEVEECNGQWYLVTRIPIFRVPESLAIAAPAADRMQRLTGQEKIVFGLVLQGKSNKEIAQAIGKSCRTVKFHVSNVLRKTGCMDRSELLLRELTRRGDDDGRE